MAVSGRIGLSNEVRPCSEIGTVTAIGIAGSRLSALVRLNALVSWRGNDSKSEIATHIRIPEPTRRTAATGTAATGTAATGTAATGTAATEATETAVLMAVTAAAI